MKGFFGGGNQLGWMEQADVEVGRQERVPHGFFVGHHGILVRSKIG